MSTIKQEASVKADSLIIEAEDAASALKAEASTDSPDSAARLRAAELRGAAKLRASEMLAIAVLQAEQLEESKTKAEEQRDLVMSVFQHQLIPLLTETASAMKNLNTVLLKLSAQLDTRDASIEQRQASIDTKLDQLLTHSLEEK